MSGSWNAQVPLMDQSMCNRIIERTDEYLSFITWRNNGSPIDLQQAIAFAKVGMDGGFECTMALRPTSRIFSDWMDWNELTTVLLRRDTQYHTVLATLRNVG